MTKNNKKKSQRCAWCGRFINNGTKCCNEIRELRKIIGTGALRSLQAGKSILRIWRRTSPHNWWIENKHGDMLWHSDEENRSLSIKMFTLIRHSKIRILTGCRWIVGRDEGRPEESKYRLKKRYC